MSQHSNDNIPGNVFNKTSYSYLVTYGTKVSSIRRLVPYLVTCIYIPYLRYLNSHKTIYRIKLHHNLRKIGVILKAFYKVEGYWRGQHLLWQRGWLFLIFIFVEHKKGFCVCFFIWKTINYIELLHTRQALSKTGTLG